MDDNKLFDAAAKATSATDANIMRGTYRELSDPDKAAIQHIKNLGEEFIRATQSCVPAGRELSLAKTKMEEAVMWAVKGITS